MDDFVRQLTLNANGLWLMAKRNQGGARLIEDSQSAIRTSVIALSASFVLILIYDYIVFPREVNAGFVAEGVSQNAHAVLNLLINVVSTLIGYYALYLLMQWMDRAQKFPAVFICNNWLGLIVNAVILPLLILSDDTDLVGVVSLLILAVTLYVAAAALQYVAEMSAGAARGITVATFLIQIFVTITLTTNFGLLVLN